MIDFSSLELKRCVRDIDWNPWSGTAEVKSVRPCSSNSLTKICPSWSASTRRLTTTSGAWPRRELVQPRPVLLLAPARLVDGPHLPQRTCRRRRTKHKPWAAEGVQFSPASGDRDMIPESEHCDHVYWCNACGMFEEHVSRCEHWCDDYFEECEAVIDECGCKEVASGSA